MDMLLALAVVIVVLVFQPGNVEINEYCSASLAGNTEESFESRAECWNYYHEYRDEIPSTE